VSGHGFTTDRREMLALTAGALVVAGGVTIEARAAAPLIAGGAFGMGRDQPLDDGWRFCKGAGDGLEAASLDDGGWREIHLPHDWSIEDLPGPDTATKKGPFDKQATGGTATGFAVGGEGWYRKHFRLGDVPADARVEVLFDGVYGECDVWLNGTHIASHLHGYAPFAVDLTPALVRGGDNVLALRVRNLGKNSRWYSGSGIYRQVKLDVLPSTARIARWGVGAWTRRIEGGRAEVEVSTTVDGAATGLTLVTRLRDAAGRVVAESAAPATGEAKQVLAVRAPHLWSPADPYLHRLETELRQGEAVLDRVAQPFGLRIVTMSTKAGLQINGERIVLRGGCIHHDNGLLGACAFADADDRRIRLLKAHGYNAIRSSHNPASSALLDACDRHGMLVLNEAFDMWHAGKTADDYAKSFPANWEQPLTAMVQSSRNRASVFMWSIGNEIPERNTAEGVEWEWKLANTVRRLDPTRPVTAALNGLLGPLVKAGPVTARPGKAGEIDNSSSIFLDVAGYNYRLEDVETDFAAHPDRIVFGSETFPKEAWDYTRLAERAPYMLGEFVWTALDYLGEAGIGASSNVSGMGLALSMPGWPWINAWCGDLDLIGNPKAPSRWRDVVWGVSKLEMAVHRPIPTGKHESVSAWGWPDVVESWNWAGQEGKPMAVHLYTPGDRVELLLNGTKVGEAKLKPSDKMMAELPVPYAPGTLEAVAYAGARVIGRKRLETVGAPAKLRLRPESIAPGASRQSLGYVSVEVLDAQGRVVPESEVAIALDLSGPATLAGFGSGNPLAVGSFQAPAAHSYRGRALAILRGTGKRGAVRVVARSNGLESAAISLRLG